MKSASKSVQKASAAQGSVLGKRESLNSKGTSKGLSVNDASTKEMEAELQRLIRENDRLKSQLIDSQDEVSEWS